MAINPNTPFTRQYVDLPTPLAIAMDKVEARGGKSKKDFVADAIRAALDKSPGAKKEVKKS